MGRRIVDDALRAAIDAEDLAEARRLLLAAAAADRRAIGLPATSALTTLQLAALHDAVAADRLLAGGAVCDLHSACALGRRQDVGRLAADAPLDALAEQLPPLGFALLRGQLAAVQALLAAGDDAERPLPRIGFYLWEQAPAMAACGAWRPLHAAAAHGYAADAGAIVAALIGAGADVEAPTPHGLRPLHLAAAYGWLPVLEALLAAGADVDSAATPVPAEVWRLAAPKGVVAFHGETPLMVAAREGKSEAASVLVHRGASHACRDSRGATALHAAARPWWREQPALAAALLAAGADRHAQDHAGYTPRDWAMAASYSETAALLA